LNQVPPAEVTDGHLLEVVRRYAERDIDNHPPKRYFPLRPGWRGWCRGRLSRL
jgi:hypothetical protein